MEIREPEPDETGRIREVADSAMTTSYGLSPARIDAIADEQFADDTLEGRLDDQSSVLLVGEADVDGGESTIAGVVSGSVDGEWGEVSWLLVDPEHRGRGLGTSLFEAATEALRDGGAERIRATVLEANTEGHQWVERFDLVREGERSIELADESVVSAVYADPDADGDLEEVAIEEPSTDEDVDFPEAALEDGTPVVTTDDGDEAFVERDEEESGTAAPFYAAYADEGRADQFGYYCSNCGSLDVEMDEMERLECSNCANSHAERSKESYDRSHL
ncbi:GNAT family N-acetyltransferase [Halovivax sp.]|uniref:GNAT family N-acetyltransferase n=1 Tax=Halovivax sp. TaxID=1935978 RepID=UPI0025BDFE0F|nr:GNAT family N-acetyltransferase [Halovivax sp.]